MIILKSKKDNLGHVVLVKKENEFATWLTTDNLKERYHGHYFDNYEDALDDYNKRIKKI